jgi:AcrR family transcriptional regulator
VAPPTGALARPGPDRSDEVSAGAGEGSKMTGKGDRQTQRTRRALLEAFRSLVTARRYEAIRVGDVIHSADVGRSTFYEHFRDKDDLLLQSMSAILDVLAGAALGRSDDRLAMVLAHFADNAPLARGLINGPSCALVVRELAQRIQVGLGPQLLEQTSTGLTASLISTQVAEAILGQVRAWLNGGCSASPADVAIAVTRTTSAMVHALTTN